MRDLQQHTEDFCGLSMRQHMQSDEVELRDQIDPAYGEYQEEEKIGQAHGYL